MRAFTGARRPTRFRPPAIFAFRTPYGRGSIVVDQRPTGGGAVQCDNIGAAGIGRTVDEILQGAVAGEGHRG